MKHLGGIFVILKLLYRSLNLFYKVKNYPTRFTLLEFSTGLLLSPKLYAAALGKYATRIYTLALLGFLLSIFPHQLQNLNRPTSTPSTTRQSQNIRSSLQFKQVFAT